jgi:hypothetical protein
MPSASQEKRPAEIIRLGADFTQALLLGESVVGANIAVTARNMRTDADATASVVVGGSPALAGATITARVQAGALGDVYEVLFKTGATNLANAYQASVNLVITDQPGGDYLLATLDQTKRYLKIPATDTSEDTLLMELIASATRYVQARTGRRLFLQTFTEDIYLDEFDDTMEVQLWEYPVLQVDSITLMPANLVSPTIITDTSVWGVSEDGFLVLRHSYTLTREPEFNRIIYRAGYGKVPDDLSQAAAAVAGTFYRNIGREGLTRERIGDYSWASGGQQMALPSGLVHELTDPVMEGTIQHYTRHSVMRA